MPDPYNPMRAAQANMRQPEMRRFYREVAVLKTEDGRHALMLDGRAARTPGKNRLAASSPAVMELVAEEWARQAERLDPADMPVTRLVNSAVDGVARAFEETRVEIARYASSDLSCYRAEAPEALAERQARAFDPVLAWAGETLGARFRLAAGVVHVGQPEEAVSAVRSALAAYDDPVALAALSALTTLTGSALLALAVARGFLSAAEAWRAALVDEDFQEERWGIDPEAAARREARWREFEAAAVVVALTRAG